MDDKKKFGINAYKTPLGYSLGICLSYEKSSKLCYLFINLIENVKTNNPLIKRVTWVSHKRYADIFGEINRMLGIKDMSKDLKVVNRWAKVTSKLNDFEWVANAINKAAMAKDEKEELSEAFYKQSIKPRACLLR